MRHTKVKTLMTPHPAIISSDATLKDAAERMEAVGCGVLPVGTEEMLEGVITDRDIVIRAVASGKDVNTEIVRNYMTSGVHYCQEDDTLQKAADLMRDYRVTRLVVKNGAGNLSGIISFGCILRKDSDAREVSAVVEHAVGRHAA